MPHWRQEGATYFVTFRLADSLPAARLAELREEREVWLKHHPAPSDEDLEAQARERMMKVETWLDQGHGSCVLQQDSLAGIVEECIGFFDEERYALFSAAIMPNHVHACVRPLGEWGLDDILKGWKSVSCRRINRVLERAGSLWQDESFDRIVRDAAHLRRVVRYIEANPGEAGVSARCWTTPAWDGWMRRGDG